MAVAARQRRRAQPAEKDVATEANRRLGHLIDFIGSNRLASLLGVSRSQPSRWRQRHEGMSPRSADLVIDLDYVLARFRRVYDDPEVFWIWLTSENPFLAARPIDVIVHRGPEGVLRGIDALAEGAFA